MDNEVTSAVVLSAKHISKSFFKEKKEIVVIRDVSLQVHFGERIAITGASGVGKSTLLHILGTLEPPTHGKVFFGENQKDLGLLSDQELSLFRNQSLGFIFQFHYLLQDFSALENVMMPALIAGYSKKWAVTKATELLKTVGLGGRLNHRPYELSGGEQQRVAIARAILLRPQLLLADELTGNLDSVNRKLVMDLLIQLSHSMGTAILLVTHDLEVAQRMDHILSMSDGCIVS